MIYLLDTDLLIFMIRGLKAKTRQARNRQQAARLLDRCRKAQAAGDCVGLSAITVSVGCDGSAFFTSICNFSS